MPAADKEMEATKRALVRSYFLLRGCSFLSTTFWLYQVNSDGFIVICASLTSAEINLFGQDETRQRFLLPDAVGLR